MSGTVHKVTKRDSFINGTLVPAGFPVLVRSDLKIGANLADPGDVANFGGVTVIAPIGPTGPNPRSPQQIPTDAVQTLAGYQVTGGATLVSEVTLPAKQRMEQINAAGGPDLGSLMDDDDDLTAGRASDIIAGLGGQTDEELRRLRAAEEDREAPRVTLTRAIDAELEKRKQQ